MIPERSRDITADWLNDALHEGGSLRDANIVSIRHEPWGVGEGFVSDMARLTVQYDREGRSLPKTMIAKLPTSFEAARAAVRPFNIYEREIRFYSEVAPQSPMRTPGFIYGDADSERDRYILLLEDCSCYQQLDQIKGLDIEQTKLVAVKLADFHARWWDSPDLLSFPWMARPGGPEATALIGTFRFCWDACCQVEGFAAMLPEGALEAGRKVYEQYQWLVESVSDENVTISHFDFRIDNMFFDWGAPQDPLIIFDWGGASISRGVGDLAYMLGASVTTDLRRGIEGDVVKLYHDRLLERGVPRYSFEECRVDYLKGLLFFTFVGALAFSSLDMSDSRGSELIRVGMQRYFTSIVDNDAISVLP